MRLRIVHPGGETTEPVVAAAVVRLGRDPACEVTFDSRTCPMVDQYLSAKRCRRPR